MTSPQITGNQPDWKSLSGTTLDGGYELKEIVEAEQGLATFRVRVLGDYTLRALARFYLVDKATAQEQVNVWQAVHRLEQQSHLSVPLGAGRLLLNGSTLAYLVFQSPDETLGDVIKGRPLKQEEALEALRSVAQGLSELHAAGFVHGSLSADEILAVDDYIRCSTASVRRIDGSPLLTRKAARYVAPESGSQNVTVAADTWCLGATLFEALTQKQYEPALFAQAEDLKHPFGVLTTACLEPDPEKRCKLADLDRISRSNPPAPKPKPVIVPVQEASEATSEGQASRATAVGAGPEGVQSSNGSGASRAADRVIFVPASRAATAATGLANPPVKQSEFTPRNSAPSNVGQASVTGASRFQEKRGAAYSGPVRLTTRASDREAEERTPRRSGWIYALAAFAFIFLLLWFFRSHTTRPHSVAGSAPAASPTPTAHTAWPTKTLAPDNKASAAPPSTAVPPTATAPSSIASRTIWRVVLYTYNREQDASSKVRALGMKHPDLRPDVLTPNGGSGPYLVVAGGQMDRQSAAKMKQRAVREGMPRDSYIQNFSK